LIIFKKPEKICKIHRLDSNDVILAAFKDPIFKETVKEALNKIIDTMFRNEQDEDYRKILSLRFSEVIDRPNDVMTTAICAEDTEDEQFPYYYAVIDAKSFGKYLIPTHK